MMTWQNGVFFSALSMPAASSLLIDFQPSAELSTFNFHPNFQPSSFCLFSARQLSANGKIPFWLTVVAPASFSHLDG
jgi:hypothetical protein